MRIMGTRTCSEDRGPARTDDAPSWGMNTICAWCPATWSMGQLPVTRSMYAAEPAPAGGFMNADTVISIFGTFASVAETSIVESTIATA